MAMRSANMLVDESETKKTVAHNPLEQFVLLAKGTKGAACQDLIKTVLEAPGVYVFSELLAQPNIREVRHYGLFLISHCILKNNLFLFCSLRTRMPII